MPECGRRAERREAAVDVRVLGELEIRSGDLVLPLGTPKQRTVLALLLARTGQFVSVDELVDEVRSKEPVPSRNAPTPTCRWAGSPRPSPCCARTWRPTRRGNRGTPP